MNRKRSMNRPRRRQGGQAAIDALEPRRMLVVDTFNAFGGNDTIDIADTGSATRITINGTVHNSTATEINVNAGGGDDVFRVQSTRSGVLLRLNGQDGNDITTNNTVLDLDAVYRGPTFFFGGAGRDTYMANNTNDATTPVNIDINQTSITKAGFGAISLFDEIEVLEYHDSNGSNRIGFTNMRDQTHEIESLAILGNGGNDTITNTASGDPNNGDWRTSMATDSTFLVGGDGTDTVRLNDAAGFGGSYTFESNTILTGGGINGPLSYATAETIDFVAAPLIDIMNLDSKPAATALRLDSGAGNDTFIVGDGDLDSNGWLTPNVTLTGGAGNDFILFDDVLDTQADGQSSHYAFGVNALAKGTPAISYSGFETQRLNVAEGFVSGINLVPAVNLNSLAAEFTSTTIDGGGRGCFANVAQGDLSTVTGALTINLAGGSSSRLNINDQSVAGVANGYQVTNGFVRKTSTGKTINYSGVGQMTLNTSTVFDIVNVDSTAAGMALTVNAGGGNDIVNFGGGNVDTHILGPVTIDGGSGVNNATVFNSDDTTAETMTLNGATLIDGFSYTFNSVDTLSIGGGPGGTHYIINGAAHKTGFSGGSGDDTFTVGGGDIDSNFPSGVPLGLSISGGGGNDALLLNDLNDTNLNSYFINTTRLDLSDAGIHWFVNWSGLEAITLDASNGTSTQPGVLSATLVEDTVIPLRINGNGGNDWVIVNDAAAPVIIHTGLGDKDMIDINQDSDTVPVTAVIDQNDDVEILDIRPGGTLSVTNGATLVKTRAATNPGSMSIAGVLDLAGGAFLSRAGGPSLATFRTMLTAGRNGGAWNGTGANGAISSSAANASSLSDGVGYGLGSQVAPTSIGPFTIAPGDTLLRYALDGDADLSGGVNLADFNRLAASFGQSNRAWTDGDSNDDGLVNLADFNALAANFGQSASPPPGASPSSNRDERDAVLAELR